MDPEGVSALMGTPFGFIVGGFRPGARGRFRVGSAVVVLISEKECEEEM